MGPPLRKAMGPVPTAEGLDSPDDKEEPERTAMNAASLARLTLLAALWGASFLFMRVAAPVLGAAQTAFGRVALAALGLLCVAWLTRLPLRFRGMLISTLVLGVLNSGLPFLLFAAAATNLPAGYSAILNATAPLMAALIGFAAFGERLGLSKALGLGLGLTGVAALARVGPVDISAVVLWSIAACLAATACYGLSGQLTKRWINERGGLDNRITALGSQSGALLVLLPLAAWQRASQPSAWLEAGPGVWGAIAGLGLLCTALAYVLYFRLISDVGPLKALTVNFVVPPFGVFWGWLILGEQPTLAHAAGAGLIGIALWLMLRPGKVG